MTPPSTRCPITAHWQCAHRGREGVYRAFEAVKCHGLRSAASGLFPASRPSRFVGVQIYAVHPFHYEALVLMADKNFWGVTVHTVVFRQFYCSTERLRFTWESCGNAAMGILDFPCAIVVHHDISRFIQLFSPTYVFPHSSEDNALARLQFSHFRTDGASISGKSEPAP
jgi:hypothetical protein